MFAIVIVAVLVAAGWLYVTVKRKRATQLADEWEGKVVEKMPTAGNAQRRQFVRVEFESGHHAFIELDTALWKTLKPGDKLVKHAGVLEPVKDNGSRDDG